jgi:ABC-type antimicrobial peptide transport system ATPase subunit
MPNPVKSFTYITKNYAYCLYVIVDNPRESAITLNNDMATIHAWSTKWLVNFNPQKTETMTITRKINKHFHPPLIMNNSYLTLLPIHEGYQQ